MTNTIKVFIFNEYQLHLSQNRFRSVNIDRIPSQDIHLLSKLRKGKFIMKHNLRGKKATSVLL